MTWDRCKLESYPPGRVLFEEGEQPEGVFIVHSGTVDLLYRSRSSELRRLNRVSAGNILGLSSVVSHGPHDYSARVRTRSKLGFIDRDAFLHTLEENPPMWLSVLRLLSHDVNASYDSLRAATAART